MSKIFTYIIYAFILLTYGASYAQEFKDQYYFKRYNIEDGLSESSINSTVTDKHGFVWLGTQSGLNKFDGYEFQSFKHEFLNSNSLSNNSIQDLEIENNNLWIGTSDGLNKIDLNTYQFTHYNATGGNTNDFRKITIDPSLNRLWAPLLQGGLYYVDIDTDELIKFNHKALNGYLIYDVVRYDETNLAVATLDAGLFLINLNSNEYVQYHKAGIGKYNLPDNTIRGLVVIEETLWIGLQSHGLVSIDVPKAEFSLKTMENSNLVSDQIFVLSKDENNNLLIGTDGGGFSILSKESGEISTYLNIEGDNNSLSANVIRSIDNTEQYIFLGTYKGGLNILNKYSKQFTTFKRNYSSKNTISAKSIKSFEEDENGFWIGSDGGGIDYLSKSGSFSKVPRINKSLNSNKVICLEKDAYGTLWIGDFNGGLFFYKDNTVTSINNNSRYNNIIGQNVWDIETDVDDNLWVGTNLGLFNYKYEQDTFIHVPSINNDGFDFQRQEIRVLKKDPKKGVWVGNIGGLYHYNPEQENFKYYTSTDSLNYINNNLVISLLVDDKHLYVGTFGSGLNIIDRKTNTNSIISTKNNQLPSDVIFGVLKDKQDRLWISSNKGITVLSDDIYEPLQTYNHNDGLQGNIFNKNSAFITKDSLLFFGGINGFNIINSDHIEFSNREAKVAISSFEIYNNSVPISPEGILSREINDAREIKIPFREANFFSFKFSGNEYVYQNRLSYAYKLEGFDTEWHYIGKERKVNFTNLSPQSYRLMLKSSFDGVDWSSEPKIINIEIIPPWWMTIYFKIIIGIVVILIIVSIYLIRVTGLKRDQLKLRHEVAVKTKEITEQNEELNQLSHQLLQSNDQLENEVNNRTQKLNSTIDQLNKTIVELDRFVYSASHELSAPLKSILGLIEVARLDKEKGNVEEYLRFIKDSISKLEKVISSLSQYSDNSLSNVLMEEIDIEKIVIQLFSELKHTESSDNHELIIKKTGSSVVLTDERKINIIIRNILSNAIKYCNQENEKHIVNVQITMTPNHWSIIVKDNGIGFESKYTDRVFEMFFRANENIFGSGLGLYIVNETLEKLGGSITVQTERRIGSTFTLKFPN